MSFFTNSENITNATGEKFEIIKDDEDVWFICKQESEAQPGKYRSNNYTDYMTALLTENLYAKVLVSGLGLGVIPQWLCNNKGSSVDVIEIDNELITTVNSMNYLHQNINIINADINNYQTTSTYDLIYFDHWFFVNDTYYESERDALVNSFSSNKTENGIILFPVHKEIF